MMLDIRVGDMGDQLHLESKKGLIFLKILEQERKGLLSTGAGHTLSQF